METMNTLKEKWLDLGGSMYFWTANVKTVEHAKAYLDFYFGPDSLRNN